MLYGPVGRWYSGVMTSPLSIQDWAWPDAWAIPAVPNPDQWAQTPDARPLDIVLAGFVGRSDVYDPFRFLGYQTEALFSGDSALVNLPTLSAMGGGGLVWAEGAPQPSLPVSREGLSPKQEQELALLLIMREGFDAWGWRLGASSRRGLRNGAFFLMLAHGFTTAARAMLALPGAPALEDWITPVSLRTPGNTTDQVKSLLGAFVRADRKDVVDALLGWGWQEQGEDLPWRDVLDGAQSTPVLERLLAVPGLPLDDLVGFIVWKAGIAGNLCSQPLRLADVVRAVVRSRRLDSEGMAAVLLQGMASGGFYSCLGMESVDGFSLESLWSSPGVLSRPLVSKPGHEQPLGRWLALVGFWDYQPSNLNFPVTNARLSKQAGQAGLAWLKAHNPVEAAWMEEGMDAVDSPQGKTHEQRVLAARLAYEGTRAYAAVRQRLGGHAVSHAKNKMWEEFPLAPHLPAAVCESQEWLVRSGSFGFTYARDWAGDEDARPEQLSHLLSCSLAVIQGDAEELTPDVLRALLEWKKEEAATLMFFWMRLMDRADFLQLPLSSIEAEKWVACIQHLPPDCFELNPGLQESMAAKARALAIDRALPAPVEAKGHRPRF